MNQATKTNVTTTGVLLAVSGVLGHGLFEVLQGYTPTEGLFIEAIGEGQRMWVHGTEGAFTLIPNFLVTGILAIAVSICIIVWSVGFVHKKHGPLVFLLLFIALFLVGGGVAQVPIFIAAWAVSTRIHKPLTWWRKVLPTSVRRWLAALWPWVLAAGVTLFVVGLAISITGFVPGLNDPDQILYLDWSIIGLGFVLVLLAYVAGFAYDIEEREQL
jgi:hypothetical protein